MKKEFDCVEMMHDGARALRNQIGHLGRDEQLKFWESQTRDLRAAQQESTERLFPRITLSTIDLADILLQLGYPRVDSRHQILREARRRLRKEYGIVGRGNRWQWSTNDPRLPNIRRLLGDLF